MAIRGERFVLNPHEIRGITKTDSEWDEKVEGGDKITHNECYIDVYFYDGGSAVIDFDDRVAERDTVFDMISGFII